jgi:hypothetical protein
MFEVMHELQQLRRRANLKTNTPAAPKAPESATFSCSNLC